MDIYIRLLLMLRFNYRAPTIIDCVKGDRYTIRILSLVTHLVICYSSYVVRQLTDRLILLIPASFGLALYKFSCWKKNKNICFESTTSASLSGIEWNCEKRTPIYTEVDAVLIMFWLTRPVVQCYNKGRKNTRRPMQIWYPGIISSDKRCLIAYRLIYRGRSFEICGRFVYD